MTKRTTAERHATSTAPKKRRIEPAESNTQLRLNEKKTAIQLAMEEAEEYEQRKETEQRRLQQLKLQATESGGARQLYDSKVVEPLSQDSNIDIPDATSGSDATEARDDRILHAESMVTGLEYASENEKTVLACASTECAINKLRLPRKLLEKWVEEPFFEKAVVGCFVRLGVGKAPGLHGEAQYKVCEIAGVDEYKYSYAFGEFQTKKALMLRIGRNQRLWRMNVISNHRFTHTELDEWQRTMVSEEQQIPSIEEVNKRKAQMRKAIFGTASLSKGAGVVPSSSIDYMPGVDFVQKERDDTYSEANVSRLVDARRKRSEIARFRERQNTTVSRLNHGQIRTRYEHEVCAAHDAYVSLLLTQCRSLHSTPNLQAAISKVEENKDSFNALSNNIFDGELDTLAAKVKEAQHDQLDASEVEELSRLSHAARKILSEAYQKLNDFRENAQDARKKRDTEAPSRTSSLHFFNEAKKQENAFADMAYGERKIQEVQQDDDAEHAVFQRRATKPMMLWTTRREQSDIKRVGGSIKSNQVFAGKTEIDNVCDLAQEISKSPTHVSEKVNCPPCMKGSRQRNGMSLQEYIDKARARP